MDKLQQLVLDPLKPLLRPVTTSLPTPVRDAIISLIGLPCYSALVLDLDVIKEPACLSLAISKALGLAIVTTSATVKVPQILNLINSRSAAGVSFVAYALETASLLITLAYNARQQFPFSTYGESALIAVQDVVVGVLVLTFAGKLATAATFVAIVAASIYVLLFDHTLIDTGTLTYFQASACLLGVVSKAPQIYTIWKEGGTGQLSAFAVFNYLFGSLIRIFTTLQEVDDVLILYGFIAGFILNVVIAAQMLYYWNVPTPTKKGTERTGKKVEKAAMAESSGVSSRLSTRTPTTRRKA